MYEQHVAAGAATGAAKAAFLKRTPLGYLVASILAGLYVGFGIVLIFTVGAPFAGAGSAAVKLVMGTSFGLALTLVVFAGSELFTGNVMFMSLGRLGGRASWPELLAVWGSSWIGNLLGSLALAWIVVAAGTMAEAAPFVAKVAAAKAGASAWVLIGRGLLCNVLVCLALWTASRTTSDSAKLVLIWWCLFAFIGSGFEHSVANMTLLALDVLGNSQAGIGWSGFGHNLMWVTLGNILGGILLAGAYHLTTITKSLKTEQAA